ncbi:two-partner secretion domain-containing protein [Trinickia acidisoli]|uniref:two-partner secretion domain-containing protein n=1 Tax=Trinickia acidisoli TaxID=2767482 RepID=UPI001A8DD005|nr:filamentous hemagglutinin N-terminal domain-containing protein [Trinickia acidisoli]
MQLRIRRAGLTVETVDTTLAPSSRARRWLSHAVLLTFLVAGAAHAGAAPGIVPDGGTQTTVTSASNGRQTVSIAPATYGVSSNTYTNFNVTQAGATLDNTSANARTIVNQVTSTNPSLIEGDITVLGSRANVVLANPNGITVNGGSFVNTGHVALATGQVSYDDVPLGSGQYQRNVLLDTQGGTITIGPGGLAGTLIGLELIAKQIQLNGPVTNTYTSSTAYVRAVAGTSQITLNTGVSPDDNNNDWLTLANTQISNPNAIAINVEPAGSITAGSISLIATDLGAGVRSAGTMLANAGDFTLSGAGDVQLLTGSSVNAAGNVSIQTSGALSLTGASVMAAAGGVTLSSDGFTATNDGATGSTVSSTNSGVVIQSSGDFTETSSLIEGATRIQNDTASLGAVTLSVTGNVANTSDATQPGTLGVVFGQSDDVVVKAGGNVVNQDARIASNDNVTISAGGDIDNVIDHTSGVNGGTPTSYSDDGHRFLFLTADDDGYSVDYGSLQAPTQQPYIWSDSGNISLSGRNVANDGGSITTNAGKITITAQQQFLNQAVFTGQAAFQQSCFIFCHESASSTVQPYGGMIEANDDIAIKAGTQAVNVGGYVDSFDGNLTVTAPTVTATGVMGYTAYDRDFGLKAWFGNSWAMLYADDDGGVFEAGSGQVTLVGQGVVNGGSFSGANGVTATNGIVTIAPPRQQPVTIGSHLGLVSWIGL